MAIDVRRTRPRNEAIVWAILAFFTLLIVVGAVALGVEAAWLIQLDTDISAWAHDVTAGSAWLDFWEFITTVFAPWPLRILLILIAGIAFYRQETMIASWLLISVVTQFVLTTITKLAYGRERPPNPLSEADGFSFPSGHAAAAAMAATALILLTLVLLPRGRWLRRILLAVWFVMALLVAASRVFLSVHYPSDVIIGLALGALSSSVPWIIMTHRTEIVAAIPPALGGHRSVAVIYNPIKFSDINEFKARVTEVSEREGYGRPMWFETTIADPGIGQTNKALGAGAQLIIVAGGDGTVRMVCGAAAKQGVPVGVLPMGTGNLLARNLGISLNLTEALEIAFTGVEQGIDLVSFTADTTKGKHHSVFLVMAGLGMDAAIMTGVNDDLKEKVGSLAYFLSGAKALRFPPTKVTVTVDNRKPRSFKARTVVIGNVGFLQGGIPLLPDAEVDDGVLDVIILAPRRFIGWLFIAWRVITRRKGTNDRLERITGEHIIISTEKPTPMQLDGDAIGEGTSIDARVLPKALTIKVPV